MPPSDSEDFNPGEPGSEEPPPLIPVADISHSPSRDSFDSHEKGAELSPPPDIAQVFHACINGCCSFVGQLADDLVCPFCHATRYDEAKQPQRLVRIVPPDAAERAAAFIQAQSKARQDESTKMYASLHPRVQTVSDFFVDPKDISIKLSRDKFLPFSREST